MLKSKIEKEGNRKHIKGTQSQETQILINGCLGDPGLLKGDLFWNNNTGFYQSKTVVVVSPGISDE